MTSETKITSVCRNNESSRMGTKRFTVYSNGLQRDCADANYFSKHNIRSLDFKCASWDKIVRLAVGFEGKRIAAEIKAKFNTEVSISFSGKAGCSCGCSPGFIGRILGDDRAKDAAGNYLSRADVRMDVVMSPEEGEAIRVASEKAALQLPAEIEAGNAQVAAERAAKQKEVDDRRAEIEARRVERESFWANRNLEYSMSAACL